jgi:succinylarginine dihydrolase
VLAELASRVGGTFDSIVVRDVDVTLDEAVSTYLFNSQLVQRPEGGLMLVAPAECREHPRVAAYLDRLLASGGPLRDEDHVRPAARALA